MRFWKCISQLLNSIHIQMVIVIVRNENSCKRRKLMNIFDGTRTIPRERESEMGLLKGKCHPQIRGYLLGPKNEDGEQRSLKTGSVRMLKSPTCKRTDACPSQDILASPGGGISKLGLRTGKTRSSSRSSVGMALSSFLFHCHLNISAKVFNAYPQ